MSMSRPLHRAMISKLNVWLLGLLILSGCSGGANSGLIKYYLERDATATTENVLRLEILGDFKPRFSISGKGFTAEVPFDAVLDAREFTKLTAEEFGEVFISITLYQENGKPYLED